MNETFALIVIPICFITLESHKTVKSKSNDEICVTHCTTLYNISSVNLTKSISKLWIWSYLIKKSLMENVIFLSSDKHILISREYFFAAIYPTFNAKTTDQDQYPLDTKRKLNTCKKFRRCRGCLLNVLCTFNLRLVSRGKMNKFVKLLYQVCSQMWR